jgi:hypothetical protein
MGLGRLESGPEPPGSFYSMQPDAIPPGDGAGKACDGHGHAGPVDMHGWCQLVPPGYGTIKPIHAFSGHCQHCSVHCTQSLGMDKQIGYLLR